MIGDIHSSKRRDTRRRTLFRQLRGEALERRLALATANPDIYDGVTIPFAATEDLPFTATGTTTTQTSIVDRNSGGWRYFTDITRTAPDNVYPTDSAGRDWRAVNYDVVTPRRPGNLVTPFAQWRGPAMQGFANGVVTDILVGPGLGVDVGAGYVGVTPAKTTFLMRKTFTVTPSVIDSGLMKLNYVCDDGCVFYINGVEVFRTNIGSDAVDVNEYAPGPSANETFQATAVDIPTAGLSLSTAVDGNVLAMEVHNAAPTSSDIGGRVELYTESSGGDSSAPTLFANDLPAPLPATAFGRLLDRTGNPVSGTSVTAFDLNNAARIAGTVTSFNAATGGFQFVPAQNYNGIAAFEYDLDDNPADATPPSRTQAHITVAAVNDPPVAALDTYGTLRNVPFTITSPVQGLLGNDSDPDEASPLSTLKVQAASIQMTPPGAGTFQLGNLDGGLSDGTFTFTPAVGFLGPVAVAYTTVDPTGLTSSSTATIQVTLSPVIPRVAGVTFQSTAGPAIDYAVSAGTGLSQLAPLPWPVANVVRLAFNTDVVVHAADLTIRGVDVCSYVLTPGGFNYDPVARTATWRFQRPDGAPLAADRLRVELASGVGGTGVHGLDDQPLDGDWGNPTLFDDTPSDTFPSGDGHAGGNFAFRVNVLPGDVEQRVFGGFHQARQVNGHDFRAMLDRQFTRLGDAGYDPFFDLTGDGAVSIADLALVQRNIGALLPEGEPGDNCPPPSPAASSSPATSSEEKPAAEDRPPAAVVRVVPGNAHRPFPAHATAIDRIVTTPAFLRAARTPRRVRAAVTTDLTAAGG